MENSNFIGQFICLGVCSPETIAIRRDPHPFLYESLIFYGKYLFYKQLLLCNTQSSLGNNL